MLGGQDDKGEFETVLLARGEFFGGKGRLFVDQKGCPGKSTKPILSLSVVKVCVLLSTLI